MWLLQWWYIYIYCSWSILLDHIYTNCMKAVWLDQLLFMLPCRLEWMDTEAFGFCWEGVSENFDEKWKDIFSKISLKRLLIVCMHVKLFWKCCELNNSFVYVRKKEYDHEAHSSQQLQTSATVDAFWIHRFQATLLEGTLGHYHCMPTSLQHIVGMSYRIWNIKILFTRVYCSFCCWFWILILLWIQLPLIFLNSHVNNTDVSTVQEAQRMNFGESNLFYHLNIES